MAMMKDFVETYRNRPASTEDFQAIVEKHMTANMNLDGKGINWFFNHYVYGTDVPRYKVDASFRKAADGVLMDIHVAQSNVNDGFMMLVPLYVELRDGRVIRFGQVRIRGNSSVDQKDIPLRGLLDLPKAAMVNYFNDAVRQMTSAAVQPIAARTLLPAGVCVPNWDLGRSSCFASVASRNCLPSSKHRKYNPPTSPPCTSGA
jgi:hypothetical protein